MKNKTGKNLIDKKINTILILVLILFLTIAIPSFCMLLTKDNSSEIEYWDGSTATSYNSGTGSENDPYIISNPQELSYFKEQINNGNKYENTYFKFTNNIHLNNGVIENKENDIIYIYDSNKYYIKPFTNEYYEDKELTKKVGTINAFETINEFKGHINGNNKFIYGLYLTSDTQKELALFNNISGKINNLYFSNILIYGNYITGLINNANNLKYDNLIFNGNIYSKSIDNLKTQNLEDIEMTSTTKTIYLNNEILPSYTNINSIKIKGKTDGTNIYINNTLIDNNEFEIELNEIQEQLLIEAQIGTKLTDLIYEIAYNNSISSVIINTTNSEINNSFIRGNIKSNNISSSLIGIVNNAISMKNIFNDATVTGKNIGSGLMGIINAGTINVSNVYNSGNINSNQIAGGLVGEVSKNSYININHSFNTGNINGSTIGAIIGKSDVSVSDNNNYYTNESISSVGNDNYTIAQHKTNDELLQSNFIESQLGFQTTIWNLDDKKLPTLKSFDNIPPTITLQMLDNEWNSINTNEITINETTWIAADYQDNESDILKVEYHIANKIYDIEEINNLEFKLYEENITLEENGNYYIIFKATDVLGNANIVTTDLITLEGYNLVISDIYNNSLKEYNNQITNNSKIKYKITRNYPMETFKYNSDTKYMIETNTILPTNTIIKFVDNINNKIYSYKTNDNDVINKNNTYLYELNLFKELGTNEDNYFNNKVIDYYQNEIIKENFEIILDFKNTNITKNYEISLNIINIYEDDILTTTYTNLKNDFILAKYDDQNKEISYQNQITTDYKDYLDFSKIASYDINLVNNIVSNKLNNKEIYNSENISNNPYLLIKILDSKDNIIKGNLINNITINYQDKTYYSNKQGTIKIPFNDNNISIKLNNNYIINDIPNGTYYLKISSCNKTTCSNQETIPINILNKSSNLNCNFYIDIDNNDRLINKMVGKTANNKDSITTNINYNCGLINPNIRIKLYKKLNFDSDNQTYELIDLKQYISNNLEHISDYEYYLIKELKENNSVKELYILANNYQYGSYKIVFQLYDGNTFIEEESKTIIVK